MFFLSFKNYYDGHYAISPMNFGGGQYWNGARGKKDN